MRSCYFLGKCEEYMYIYTVKAGDTLYSVAEKYGVSYRRLLYDNGIIDPARLVEGQSLLVLVPEMIYTVQKGDSLYSIAEKYGTSVMELRRNNPYITDSYYLSEGEKIVISYKDKGTLPLKVSGFVYSTVNRRLLDQILPSVTYLMIFGYGFDEMGNVVPVNAEEIVQMSHSSGTAVLLSLSLIDNKGSFASSKLVPLLTDSIFQNKVLDGMLSEIRRLDADGMDIDMEYIPTELKSEFIAFIANAADKLHNEGYILNVDLAPKTSSDQKGLLYEAHDYKAIGEISDLIFLMTYEWGYAYGEPMAIAPYPNVKRVLEYALTEIPSEKIFLGMPNYAYDWTLPQIKGVTRAETIGPLTAVYRASVYNARINFDETAESPYYNYTGDSGREHIVWFEDVRSYERKFQLIREKGITGAGWWNFMRPFPQGYQLMNNMFAIEKIM